MRKDHIEITGITSHDCFPTGISECFCKQICETDKLCIPNKKPDIESICQVFGDICVSSYKIICTPLGKKLVIEGMKCIKVLYVGDEPCQNMHCAHFEIPFCIFILLKDIDCEIVDVFTGIEHISIHQLDCRCFTVSMIIFACPIFKKKHHHCHDYNSCETHVNCDIHVNCYSNAKRNECNFYNSCNPYFHKAYKQY